MRLLLYKIVNIYLFIIIGNFKLLFVEQFVRRVIANCLAENMPFLQLRSCTQSLTKNRSSG